MSACLFMSSREAMKKLTNEELEDHITKWSDCTENYDAENCFQRDRAGGYKYNIAIAQVELRCRKLGMDEDQIISRFRREGFFVAELVQAMLDAKETGKGTLEITAGGIVTRVKPI